MHHRASLFVTVLTLTVLAASQQKPPRQPTPSATSKTKTAATSQSAAPSLPSEQTVNAFLQQTFGYDSSVSWKILEIRPSEAVGLAEVSVLIQNPQGQQNSKIYVTSDGEHAVLGEIIPFGAHPYRAAKDRLQRESFGPSRGPANAPAVLVEFSDLQCPHCKAAQPIIDKLVSEEPNLRVVFQSFPLPMHDWAAKAAAYADCIARSSNDSFWKFLDATYNAQGEITASNSDEKLQDLANQAGAKGSEIATCAAQPETVGRVQRSTALGAAVGVTSTPTVFLNGRKINAIAGVPPEMLKKLVEFAATQSQ